MPINICKFFVDKLKINKWFHRRNQYHSTDSSEKPQQTEPPQSSIATPSAPLSHDYQHPDSLFSPLDGQHEVPHAGVQLSVNPAHPGEDGDHEDSDVSLRNTRRRTFDENVIGSRLSQEEYGAAQAVDMQRMRNIAQKRKEVQRRTIKVRIGRDRIEEQTDIVQYKLEELNEMDAALQMEMTSDPSNTQQRNSKRFTELVQAVQRASTNFTREANKFDRLQKKVQKMEGRLKEAETDLYHLMGDEQVLDDEIDSSSTTSSDAESSTPDVPYNVLRVTDRESENDIDSINEMIQVPNYQESFYTGELSEHNQAEEMLSPGLNSDLMDLALFDRAVQSAGEQFLLSDDDSGSILPEEYDLSQINIFVRMKRRRDLASIPDLWPLHKSSETTNFDHFYDPGVTSLSLSHRISYWILQYFACSWLEFSRYVLLTTWEPAIDQIIVSVGYFHLSSLIYSNWFCDEHLAQPQRVLSMYPSVSDVTDDDVPRHYHQIFIPESDDGMKDIEYIQLRVSSTLPALTDVRPASIATQPVYSERSPVQVSTSSKSSKAPSQIFDHPPRMDTLLTEWADSRERIPAPCNNTVS